MEANTRLSRATVAVGLVRRPDEAVDAVLGDGEAVHDRLRVQRIKARAAGPVSGAIEMSPK
jgi:hypothetical protein